jgi:hypothetical protein
MKLRIRSNSIRFRLTQSEVEKLKETGSVEEKTEFQNGQTLIYSISAIETETLSAEFSNGKINLITPKSTIESWADSEEVGIYSTREKIQISIEKDFKCLTPRQGEEDIDTFPHPKEKTETC